MFSDATLSNINVVLCYVLLQYTLYSFPSYICRGNYSSSLTQRRPLGPCLHITREQVGCGRRDTSVWLPPVGGDARPEVGPIFYVVSSMFDNHEKELNQAGNLKLISKKRKQWGDIAMVKFTNVQIVQVVLYAFFPNIYQN